MEQTESSSLKRTVKEQKKKDIKEKNTGKAGYTNMENLSVHTRKNSHTGRKDVKTKNLQNSNKGNKKIICF